MAITDSVTFYCDVCDQHALHKEHHDNEYGLPQTEESVLFERLCLEIFQAGLNWLLVLKKRPALNELLYNFDVDQLAAMPYEDQQKFLNDPRGIRNKAKLNAILENAGVVQNMRESHGGFSAWLAAQHPRSVKAWIKTFRQTFKFMGPEIVNEFLMSLGYIPGAHHRHCFRFDDVASAGPLWLEVDDPPADWRRI